MNQKIGVLGGGQLGKMLYSAGVQLDMNISFMDMDESYPVAKYCSQYSKGDFTSYDDVLHFGLDKDIVTIEIERINVEALYKLQSMGKKVYPQPHIIEMIQDKGKQKDFYTTLEIPTSAYKKYDNSQSLRDDIKDGHISYPFITKARKDGYDGRGVKVVRTSSDLSADIRTDFIVEDLINIEKELSIICCRSPLGEVVCYDAVEMVFHPEENILLYQLAPARIHPKRLDEAKDLALKITNTLQIVGLLAIEMFVTEDGQVLVNEMAPRPHNSGHHSIESCFTSQYENHLRAISGLPLGSTRLLTKSLLMNVLGSPKHAGPATYKGLDNLLKMEGVNLHLYGKQETRPFRKMGHINIIGDNCQDLVRYYETISKKFSVVSQESLKTTSK